MHTIEYPSRQLWPRHCQHPELVSHFHSQFSSNPCRHDFKTVGKRFNCALVFYNTSKWNCSLAQISQFQTFLFHDMQDSQHLHMDTPLTLGGGISTETSVVMLDKTQFNHIAFSLPQKWDSIC